jgi:hypothetical protein
MRCEDQLHAEDTNYERAPFSASVAEQNRRVLT